MVLSPSVELEVAVRVLERGSAVLADELEKALHHSVADGIAYCFTAVL